MFTVTHSDIRGDCEDVLIVKVLSGGSERNIVKIYDECEPKALGLIAYPSKNSLAAALEAAEVLPRAGVCFVRNEKDEEECIKTFERMSRFIKSKVALIGGVAPWLVAQKANPDLFNSLFGMTIETIAINELVNRYYEIEENEKLERVIKNIVAGTSNPEEVLKTFTEEQLKELAKLHVVLSELISRLESKGFKAFAINCFEIIKQLNVTPCVTIAHLLTAKKPIACEGDLDSLLSQIFTLSVFNRVGGIFNLDYYEEGYTLFAHCTAPLYMAVEYTLVPHYETGKPAAVKARFDEGEEYSALKFKGDGFEVLEGKSVNMFEIDACRSQLWLKHSPDFVPWGNHRVIVNSQNWERIKFLADSFGLKSSQRFRSVD